ncbi:MAG: DUF1049 domain-containing protein [Nitratireductor sp.]|nr:DUF1049 domain-containing protein [Nitratireductor sp.]
MKRILSIVLAVPVGIALIVASVANRQTVTLRLDPFNEADPALSLDLPFFAFLFAALLVGMIVGAVAVWLGQGKHRRSAKRERGEARKWRDEAEQSRKRADELAATLAASQSSAVGIPAPEGGDREKAA